MQTTELEISLDQLMGKYRRQAELLQQLSQIESLAVWRFPEDGPPHRRIPRELEAEYLNVFVAYLRAST